MTGAQNGTEKQRIASSVSSWTGFLPERAVVMAKARPLSLNTPDPSIECPRCGQPELLGDGNPAAELVFIGEQHRPFSGPAGELLDKMLEAMGLKREQLYLSAVFDCPGCNTFLEQKLDAMHPKVVVALGQFAAQHLLQTSSPISELRAQFYEYRGARLMPTFHPEDLLKSPASKREAWADLQSVARELGLKLPSKK